MSRRELLGLAAGAAAVGVTGCGDTLSTAPPAASRRRRLRVAPPRLRHARTVRLGRRVTVEGADVTTTDAATTVTLYGAGRDWRIVMPEHAPLDRTLVIDGRDQARHIVVVGGAIRPVSRVNPATTKLPDGSWGVSAERGFSGATGGSFRVRVSEDGAYTAPIAWDAAPPAIAAAIEAVLGSGSVRAVDGRDAPGGPWRFVPADARLGRVTLDVGELEGPVRAVVGPNVYEAGAGGLLLKQWRGTAHVEGVAIGGPGCGEGIGVQTPWADAVLQLASTHVSVSFWDYHDDWHHPDGMQCYLGPATLLMDRCDLISRGTQAIIGQPRQTDKPAPLQALRDWSFTDVLFQTRSNPSHPGTTPGNVCYMEDDWPHNNGNRAGWQWRMSNCYASRLQSDGRERRSGALAYFNHYPLGPPAGLRLGQAPARIFADERARECGLRYRAPGYASRVLAPGTLRLRGESKLT